jgi:CRP-like cAMP-binding protein
MHIRQTDLFWGLHQNVVNRIMGIAQRDAYAAGQALFRVGDAARHLFILVQGEICVTVGESETPVYTGGRVGEVFGLGSLIDRDTYGGSATCATAVVVLKLERDRLVKILESDTASGYLFYKHLSKALGGRLMRAYHKMAIA